MLNERVLGFAWLQRAADYPLITRFAFDWKQILPQRIVWKRALTERRWKHSNEF